MDGDIWDAAAMSGHEAEFSLVLLGRYPGKDRQVAQAFARAFGRDEAWGLPIVGASPISVLTGLGLDQAQAILAALAEVEAAGCRLQIQPGLDSAYPTVAWPAPPHIHGRAVPDFAPPRPDEDGTRGAVAVVACPHCGKPIQLQAAAPTTPPAAGPGLPLALPLPIPVPMRTGMSSVAPLPPLPLDSAAGRRASKTLPDVPVLDGERPAASPPPAPSRSADPRLKAPADMATFEAGLALTPPPDGPAPAAGSAQGVPGSTPGSDPGLPRESADVLRSSDPQALCSIFIGRSSAPPVHQLVAEAQGIPLDEAQRLCQKAVVPVAHDIPVSKALELRAALTLHGVHPRVILKR